MRGWSEQKGEAEGRSGEDNREKTRECVASGRDRIVQGENFSPLIKSVDNNTRWTYKSYLMIYATDILNGGAGSFY